MYTADNMSRLLGQDATDIDAQTFASFLEAEGWELIEDSEGQMVPYLNNVKMSEGEWQNALRACFA